MCSLRLIIKITLIHPHSDRSHHRVPWQHPLVTRIIFWALKIPSSFNWLILSVPMLNPRGRKTAVLSYDGWQVVSLSHSLIDSSTRVNLPAICLLSACWFHQSNSSSNHSPTHSTHRRLLLHLTSSPLLLLLAGFGGGPSLREYKWFINQSLFRSGATTHTGEKPKNDRTNAVTHGNHFKGFYWFWLTRKRHPHINHCLM